MSWTHIEDTRPKARKPHECYLCGGVIAIGELHVRRYGVNEGRREATRMHESCEKVTREWDEEDWLFFDRADFVAATLNAKLKGTP